MNFTSQKSTFQTYTNGIDGTSPHIGEEAKGEEVGYWYIGTTNTGVKAAGADALTMLLSNDSDIIVRNNLGQIIGDLPTTQVFVLRGANQIENPDIIKVAPTDFEEGTDKHYTFENGLLTIRKIPDGFKSGAFTFTHSGIISKTFPLKVVSSEVDYNLIIDKTLINSTEKGGTVKITVKKISADGTKILEKPAEEEQDEAGVQLRIDDDENHASSWQIEYDKGYTTAIPVKLEVQVGNEWVVWDEETIEFVANGAPGGDGASLQVIYKKDTTAPTRPTGESPEGWYTSMPSIIGNEKIYMSQKMSNSTAWSDPIQISAIDGSTPTVSIEDGKWVINGNATDVPATGDPGHTPEIKIEGGCWVIDGTPTGQKAQGEPGKDGGDIEYVYYLCNNDEDDLAPTSPPSYNGTTLTSGWTPSPSGVTLKKQYEYVSVRTKPTGGNWGSFSDPVVWSKWGEKGQDGDGVSYYYCRTNSDTKPTYPAPQEASYTWEDEPQGVTNSNQYEYVVAIKTGEVVGSNNTKTGTLWAKWSEDGDDSVAYWLQRSTPIIAKKADGTYQTTSVLFTPMKQIGSKTPEVCSSNEVVVNIYAESVKVDNKLELSPDMNGVYTVSLGKGGGEVSITKALCAQMMLKGDGSNPDIKVDEETVEVLADGVTITKIEYAVHTDGVNPPTSWSTTYPSEIPQGSFLWTQTTYSNGGDPALSSVYQPKDGTNATEAFTIHLTNNTATIGTDVNGNRTDWSLLPDVATTTVSVWEGGTNITEQCEYRWTTSNGALLNNYDTNSVAFDYYKDEPSRDPLGIDSVLAEISVFKIDGETRIDLGTKSFTVTKLKSGEPGKDAVTYSLAVSPNSWNLDESSSISPTFIVTKYTGNIPSTMTTGYTIKVGNNSYAGNGITETTTFDLWIDQIKVDSETVTAVQNGNDSTEPGPMGKTAGTIVLYKASNDTEKNKPKAPNTPTSTTPAQDGTLNGWSITAPGAISTSRFIWKTMGTYSEDANGENRDYGTSWTAPELHSAYYPADVSGSTAAEYYKLFGTDSTNQGMKFNDSGQLYINASMINTGTLTITKGGNDDDKDEVLFSAGWNDNTDGTKTGSVYINGLTVGEIASKQDIGNIEIGGRNLIADTDNTTEYSGNKEDNEYKDVWTSTIVAPTDTQYVISFDAKAEVAQNIKCFFYAPNTTLTSESSTGQFRKDAIDGTIEVSITTEWKRYWVKWTQTPTNGTKNIIVGRNDTANNIYIRAVKLEKGNKATAWTPAPEDQVSSNVNNAFSWKFSPTEGMFMWNGAQGAITAGNPTGGAVFAIYNDKGTHKLAVKGHIEAESGKIAGWEIQNDPSKGKIPAILYGAFGKPNSFHMYAGDKEGTLYRVDLNGKDIFRVYKDNWRLTIGNNFGVTSNGEIHAYKGSLAGIDISGDNLTWSNKKGELVSLLSGTLNQGTARPVGNSEAKENWFLWTRGKFGVDAEGVLYATDANISGAIAAGLYTTTKRFTQSVTMKANETKTLKLFDENSGYKNLTVKEENIQVNNSLYHIFDAENIFFTLQEDMSSVESSISFDLPKDVNYAQVIDMRVEYYQVWQDDVLLSDDDWYVGIGGYAYKDGKIHAKVDFSALTDPVSYERSFRVYYNISCRYNQSVIFNITSSSNSLYITCSPKTGHIIPSDKNFTATITATAEKVSSKFSVTQEGSVYATAGEIGGWTIGPLGDSQGKHIGLLKRADNSTSGLAAIGDVSSVAFWAGCPGGTPWEVIDYDTKTGFYVTEAGVMRLMSAENKDKLVQIGSGGGLQVFDIDETAKNTFGGYTCAQYSANVIRFGITDDYKKVLSGEKPPTNKNEINFDGKTISMSGTWRGTVSGVITSDSRLKHNIEELDDRYEAFYNGLGAVRFKYNDGTSNRFHTGFIAQNVQKSLASANLSEQELAALCTFDQGRQSEHMGLRYEEFISLNTWQIQKLKPRVSSLEQTILEYETRISNLENQLKNLTS